MTIKVAVHGASGETGRSIVDGLLASSTDFEITGLARPGSINSAANAALKAKGVKVVALDLTAPEEALVQLLRGIDIVISAINWQSLKDQIPLADAAKKAGVERFIPCNFATVDAPKSMPIRDLKEEIIDHIKTIYLPYTVIEVGWWYQLSMPRLASGRLDEYILMGQNVIAGTGDIPWARTDLRDIGRIVARVIVDDRTLNKYVFAYADLASQNDVIRQVEQATGEQVETTRISEEEIREQIATLNKDPTAALQAVSLHYLLSQGIRGYNTPEYAQYLGYLNGRELYPDLQLRSFGSFIEDMLAGKVERVFKGRLQSDGRPEEGAKN